MRQEKTHQAYRTYNQAGDDNCLQGSKGALRFLIQGCESRANKSSVAPVRFIDSFLHNSEESIIQAKLIKVPRLALIHHVARHRRLAALSAVTREILAA